MINTLYVLYVKCVKVGKSWSPNACETCYCTDEKIEGMGFYVERCYENPCPAFDKKACTENGGLITTTDDGCCTKCQATECYECNRQISTLPKYLVLEDECASVVPIVMSYCDGFCRGSYYWSLNGPIKKWSCCKPTTKIASSILLRCHNGSEVVYHYEDVIACECSSNCRHNVIQKPTSTYVFTVPSK